MSDDTPYRQKRCPHGWTGTDCPTCAELAAKDAEIKRLREDNEILHRIIDDAEAAIKRRIQ